MSQYPEKVPIIPARKHLNELSNIDKNKDVYILWPIYQEGKLIAYQKITYLAPGWHAEKIVWQDNVEFPE